MNNINPSGEFNAKILIISNDEHNARPENTYNHDNISQLEEPIIPRMVNIKEAEKLTGLSYYTLRQLCLEDRIVYFRSGVKYYINLDKLIEFLNQEHAV